MKGFVCHCSEMTHSRDMYRAYITETETTLIRIFACLFVCQEVSVRAKSVTICYFCTINLKDKN